MNTSKVLLCLIVGIVVAVHGASVRNLSTDHKKSGDDVALQKESSFVNELKLAALKPNPFGHRTTQTDNQITDGDSGGHEDTSEYSRHHHRGASRGRQQAEGGNKTPGRLSVNKPPNSEEGHQSPAQAGAAGHNQEESARRKKANGLNSASQDKSMGSRHRVKPVNDLSANHKIMWNPLASSHQKQAKRNEETGANDVVGMAEHKQLSTKIPRKTKFSHEVVKVHVGRPTKEQESDKDKDMAEMFDGIINALKKDPELLRELLKQSENESKSKNTSQSSEQEKADVKEQHHDTYKKPEAERENADKHENGIPLENISEIPNYQLGAVSAHQTISTASPAAIKRPHASKHEAPIVRHDHVSEQRNAKNGGIRSNGLSSKSGRVHRDEKKPFMMKKGEKSAHHYNTVLGKPAAKPAWRVNGPPKTNKRIGDGNSKKVVDTENINGHPLHPDDTKNPSEIDMKNVQLTEDRHEEQLWKDDNGLASNEEHHGHHVTASRQNVINDVTEIPAKEKIPPTRKHQELVDELRQLTSVKGAGHLTRERKNGSKIRDHQ